MSELLATSQRPERAYSTGPITKGLRRLGVLGTLGVTAWILVRYPSLPSTIATHFTARGQADGWGPRWSILVLAAGMLVLSLGLAAASKRPRLFNYPAAVTPINAQAIYREGERMMVWTLLGVVVIYAGIAWSVVRTGGTVLTGGGPLIAGGVALTLAAVVIGIVRLLRAAR